MKRQRAGSIAPGPFFVSPQGVGDATGAGCGAAVCSGAGRLTGATASEPTGADSAAAPAPCRNRSAIANSRRLLKLNEALQGEVAAGRLSAGHGRALLAVEDADRRDTLAAQVIEEQLSVRATERLVKESAGRAVKQRAKATAGPLAPYLDGLAEEIGQALGVTAAVKLRGRQGKLTLQFHGVEQLRALRDRLVRLED